MTGATTRLHPDPRACAVARAVADDVYPDTVILFGSRARGDFTTDSDVDLLIVAGSAGLSNKDYCKASEIAFSKMRELYDHPVDVDLVQLTADDFNEGRRAKNHVAGQAVRDGFHVNEDKVTYDNPNPSNWPDIRQRIINSQRELDDLAKLIEVGGSQEAIGFHAQQSIENALKGWISALDADYTNTHNLVDLAAIVRRHPSEDETPAGERQVWLTEYAVRYRYHGIVVDVEDRSELFSSVSSTVHAIIDRIHTLTDSVDQ